MTLEEIVFKLVGPTHPVGDSSIDPDRKANLKVLCDLTEQLIYHIAGLKSNSIAYESSVKEIGDYATKRLASIKEEL